MENVLNKIKFSDDTYIDNHMLLCIIIMYIMYYILYVKKIHICYICIFFITQFSMKQG